jgi:hypothetical protein
MEALGAGIVKLVGTGTFSPVSFVAGEPDDNCEPTSLKYSLWAAADFFIIVFILFKYRICVGLKVEQTLA